MVKEDNQNFIVLTNLNKDDFNFIYISKPQSSGGFVLELEKIIKKKEKKYMQKPKS